MSAFRVYKKGYWRAWGQDPTRPGNTFRTEADAKAWAEKEAPLSCGFAFVQSTSTLVLQLYRAETNTWS
jgi:hypothetical protein